MKTIEEIYGLLREAYAQRTGTELAEDCDLAVRLYAAAAQLQALDIQTWWVLDQCFPQTAQGTYLDGHALMRGITRRAATKAAGSLRFSVASPSAVELTIAAGTACMTEGEVRFQTTADGVLPAGELSVDVPRWASPAVPIPPPFPAAATRKMTRACARGCWRAISDCPTAPTLPGMSRPP